MCIKILGYLDKVMLVHTHYSTYKLVHLGPLWSAMILRFEAVDIFKYILPAQTSQWSKRSN